MADIKISEMTTAATLNGTEVSVLSQSQGGQLVSVKATLQAIANWFAVNAEYTSALNTTDKRICGAINELKQLISLIPQFSIEVVQVLPTEDISDTTIYLVPAEDPEVGNYYEEYIHVNDLWELVGTTAVDLSAYYTKLEVDAKFSALATVATSGSYNDLTNKPDLSALMDVHETTFENPYIKKVVPSGQYTEKLKKLIGATVVWNQLVKNGNFADTSNWTATRGTFSVTTNVGKLTATSASAYFQVKLESASIGFLANNVYRVRGRVKSSNTQRIKAFVDSIQVLNVVPTAGSWEEFETIIKTSASASGVVAFGWEGTPAVNDTLEMEEVCVTNLTAMFGSTIADYVNTLETAQAGSGIAWLKSYGFFTEPYYAYSANTMQSVSVSAKVNKDSEDTTISTVALDHTTLRGLFKLDANNNLYADGDEYLPSGVENVQYEERAYQSGDESLANAITDGTTTVVKLTTPTTATLTPYTSLQNIESGGTEEFIDYEVSQGNRDVSIPVGNESLYGDNALMGKVVNYINS